MGSVPPRSVAERTEEAAKPPTTLARETSRKSTLGGRRKGGGENANVAGTNNSKLHQLSRPALRAGRSTCPAPNGICTRKYWSLEKLETLAGRLGVGDGITVVWSRHEQPGTRTWKGTVKCKHGGFWKVHYPKTDVEPEHTLVFPPARQQQWKVRRVTIQRKPKDQWLKKKLKQLQVGSRVLFKFERDFKSFRWTGTVVPSTAGTIRVQYDQYRKASLPLPPPESSGIVARELHILGKRAPPAKHTLTEQSPVATAEQQRDDRESDTTLTETEAVPLVNEEPEAQALETHSSHPKHRGFKEFTVMTFNTRSLQALWRQRELAEYLKIRKTDLVALQETRCQSQPLIEGYTTIAVPADKKGKGGVAILVRQGLIVQNQKTNSDNDMITVTVTGEDEKSRITFVTAHAPHGAYAKEQLATWWNHFDKFVEEARVQSTQLGKPSPLVVLGDLNARAKGRRQTTLRQKTNAAAVEFENWLHQKSLVCCNAMFTKPKERLITFNGSNRSAQLDVITIEERWKTACSNCHSIQPPIPSDHRPLVATLRMRLKRKRKVLEAAAPPPNWSSLQHSAELTNTFVAEVKSHMATCPAMYLEALVALYGRGTAASQAKVNVRKHPPITYSDFAQAVCHAVHVLPVKHSSRSEPEAAEEDRVKIRTIHDIAVQHNALKGSWTAQINREVVDAIDRFESLGKTHPSDAFKMISRLAGTKRGPSDVASKSTDEEILKHNIKVNGKERGSPAEDLGFLKRLETNVVNTGPFSKEEVRIGLSALNNNRATGLDGVPAEVVKIPEFQELMHGFANRYLTGEVPKEVLMSEIVLLAKKGDSRFVENCRGISLTSIFLKLVNRLLMNRLRVLDKDMEPWQNGFRPYRNTVQHAMAIKMLIDRAKAANSPLVTLYIDFTQAFPSVTPEAVKQMLRAWRIPEKFIDAVMQCYIDHTVHIRNVDGTYTVKSGVLQGDTLAPLLFCMVLDCILHTAIDPSDGVPIDGSVGVPPALQPRPPTTCGIQLRQVASKGRHTIPYTAFADDICLVTQNIAAAERQLRAIQTLSRKAGLDVNCKKGKTEYMTMNLESIVGSDAPTITGDQGEVIGLVDAYVYLGTTPFTIEEAFQSRLGKAWGAVKRLNHLWKCPDVKAELKHKLMQTLVQSVFVYGAPLWPTTVEWRDRIDRSYTRLLRYCVGSDTALELYRHGAVPHLSSIITLLRFNTVGHALRHEQPLSMLLRTPARCGRQLGLERQIRQDLKCVGPPDEWDIAAQDRQEWRKLARISAAENEDRIWHRLDGQRRKRWMADDRLERRALLLVLNALSEHSVFIKGVFQLPHYQHLLPYSSPPRVNIYNRAAPSTGASAAKNEPLAPRAAARPPSSTGKRARRRQIPDAKPDPGGLSLAGTH